MRSNRLGAMLAALALWPTVPAESREVYTSTTAPVRRTFPRVPYSRRKVNGPDHFKTRKLTPGKFSEQRYARAIEKRVRRQAKAKRESGET